MKGNYVVLDCETGGLDCLKNPITQIALMSVDCKTMKEIERYETFVKPYNDLFVDPISIEKTMVTMNDLKDGLDSKELVDNLIKFFKAASKNAKHPSMKPMIVGHNIAFDVAFISELFRIHKKNLFEFVSDNNSVINFVDTLQTSRIVWGGDLNKTEDQSFTLTSCLKRAKLSLTDAHGAMNDVIATFRLFQYFRQSFSKNTKNVQGELFVAENEEKATKTRNFFKI